MLGFNLAHVSFSITVSLNNEEATKERMDSKLADNVKRTEIHDNTVLMRHKFAETKSHLIVDVNNIKLCAKKTLIHSHRGLI